MKTILIIKNGVCDVDKSLQQIINRIDNNIKTDVITSYDLVQTMGASDCMFYDSILICGGQQSLVNRHDKDYLYPYLNELIKYTTLWIEAHMCVLGICLGAQIVGEACGLTTQKLELPIMGYQQNIQLNYDNINKNTLLADSFSEYLPFLLCCHYDFIQIDHTTINNNFNIDAQLKTYDNVDKEIMIPYAFSIKNAYAVQFHPEMNDELLQQVKYYYPSLETSTQFIKDNMVSIDNATMSFFSRWIVKYIYFQN